MENKTEVAFSILTPSAHTDETTCFRQLTSCQLTALYSKTVMRENEARAAQNVKALNPFKGRVSGPTHTFQNDAILK